MASLAGYGAGGIPVRNPLATAHRFILVNDTAANVDIAFDDAFTSPIQVPPNTQWVEDLHRWHYATGWVYNEIMCWIRGSGAAPKCSVSQ